MNDIAIRVEKLGKKYRIGSRHLRKADPIAASQTPVVRLWSKIRPSWLAPAQTIWALRDISFEIKQADIVGIIGGNGAGKSTLLKILSHVTEPTEGVAEIFGRVGSLLEIGIGFHPELTGRENIYLNGAILGMKKKEIEQKFDAIVDFAEVGQFIDTALKYYSSGMYLRLAFAVAVHLNLDILLVDEILAVGDINFQQKCIHAMEKMSQDGCTVLLVSHNMRVIETLANHCLYMKHEQPAQYGDVLPILQQYQKDIAQDVLLEDLPAEFALNIAKPKVNITELQFHSLMQTLCNPEDTELNQFPTAPAWSSLEKEHPQPASITFELQSDEDIAEAVICINFCKDKIVIARNSSDHSIHKITLTKGQRLHCKVAYNALPLVPGEYIVIVFLLPSRTARPSEAISKLRSVKAVLHGNRTRGGYVVLEETWKIEPLSV